VQCYHDVTPDGRMRVELEFAPSDLERMDELLRALLRESGRALKLARAVEAQHRKDAEQVDLHRSACRLCERIALSVLARTDNMQLAAQASGLQVGHVRIAQRCADEKRRALAGRNLAIVALVDAGTPRDTIAEKYGLHVKSIPRIVRETRKGRIIGQAQGIIR